MVGFAVERGSQYRVCLYIHIYIYISPNVETAIKVGKNYGRVCSRTGESISGVSIYIYMILTVRVLVIPST